MSLNDGPQLCSAKYIIRRLRVSVYENELGVVFFFVVVRIFFMVWCGGVVSSHVSFGICQECIPNTDLFINWTTVSWVIVVLVYRVFFFIWLVRGLFVVGFFFHYLEFVFKFRLFFFFKLLLYCCCCGRRDIKLRIQIVRRKKKTNK